MPNHVHILFSLVEGQPLEKVIQGWKRVFSIGINRVLGQDGTLWQKDYFDTMIRDWEHFSRVARYIRKNPSKAKLRDCEYSLRESDLVKKLLG
jgi:putative transposase